MSAAARSQHGRNSWRPHSGTSTAEAEEVIVVSNSTCNHDLLEYAHMRDGTRES